jgi:glycosyltransferase involved in cell wall biosynthesis
VALLAPFVQGPIESRPPPSFSIIIAAFQAAAYIAEAIESALAQTYPAQEIVVCDDGSTDDLDRALKPYGEQIVLLRQENRGQSVAKNAAAQAATAEFISILDADDVFLPHYLEAVAEAASVRPDLDIITTNAYLEVDGRIIGQYYTDIARFVIGDQRRGIIHNHFIFGLASLRRSSLLAVGGFDESVRRVPDTDCFLRMILAGSRAGLVDTPLAYYRLQEGSVSSDRVESMREAVEILERAQTHPTLDPDERTYLERTVRAKRGEVTLAAAEDAVRFRKPNARRYALEVAFGDLPSGFGHRTRLNGLVAAIAPSLARRYLRRRAARGGFTTLRTKTRGR